MFQPPFRGIDDASHHLALAVHLHLHCPHQLCHPSCIVMLVIRVVDIMVEMLIMMRMKIILIC